ncbi:sulfite exporter TauE/SafE family protein [Pelagovum sp. HNIBRBA483]|uniref:sulfite exporter TauE/SafE family protein n=1 Tax=Pelagovum sp. HNIBRBA483 TaxID=3233341 RepID=UPI0034A3065E
MEPMTLIITALLILALGAVAGVLAGMLGVGGGIVLVPGFVYIFTSLGYDGPMLMQVCLATSLATIIVTSARSVMAHHKRGAVEWGILRGWAAGIALGAVLGVAVAAWLKSDVLQLIFAGLAFCVALYLIFGRTRWQLGTEMPRGVLRMIIAPVIGLLSVLMGIGGGSLGVPLMSLHGVPMHRAVATAAGFGALIAVPSVLAFLFVPVDASSAPPWTVGAVNVPTFLIVISMTLITAPYGATLAHRLDAKRLRRAFGFFLIFVSLNMMRKAVGW